MPLYARDQDDPIFAANAERGKTYRCIDCSNPVRVRRGKDRFPHFYHLQSSPRCRLYSKSEDHLRAQLQLQKLFPEGAAEIERPFPKINRIADLCWENKKIVFEIQCSLLNLKEAESRIDDYRTAGYEIVWLLDDRLYNRRILRPEESFLRHQCSYFLSLRQGLTSVYYDQFEIFAAKRRVKRGQRMSVDLLHAAPMPKQNWSPDLPEQILKRIPNSPFYFYGDRLHRALQSANNPSLALLMNNWRALEMQLGKESIDLSPLKLEFQRRVSRPYFELLDLIAGFRN